MKPRQMIDLFYPFRFAGKRLHGASHAWDHQPAVGNPDTSRNGTTG